MSLKMKERTYSGLRTPDVCAEETLHRTISRRAAAEGIVLLKNDGLLPLQKGMKVLLLGSGAMNPIKGGTGSGDVNQREIVTPLQGLQNAGFEVINSADVEQVEKAYIEARYAWRDKIFDLVQANGSSSDMNMFDVYTSNPFTFSGELKVDRAAAAEADAVIYIISRVAGEGADRFVQEGDYYLSESEAADLKELEIAGAKVAVLVNAGGQIDLIPVQKNTAVSAIMAISQGGMEMGNALADVLCGAVTPSGKLTDSWAEKYEDYPTASYFSHNNNDVQNEKYPEGIYVGYRYFDSFGVQPMYPFGFGLSYTTFSVEPESLCADGEAVSVKVRVTNTGAVYSGREVVQIYAACSQDGMRKEAKRLIAYAKTRELAPGEAQVLTITAKAELLASYCEACASMVVTAGDYYILAGNSSADLKAAGVLQTAETVVVKKVHAILPLQEELEEIQPDPAVIDTYLTALKEETKDLPLIAWAPVEAVVKRQPEAACHAEAEAVAAKLTKEELVPILLGEISKGQDNIVDGQLVTSGIFVPGAAGETTGTLLDYNVPAVSMADGPAGLRLLTSYEVDKESGLIYGKGLLSALENGLFGTNLVHENADTYYQYATALPIGTLLAQTWDTALVEEIGALVGDEMNRFGVGWWLAPGLNIHRDPLCGRNFEYYSEDPLIAGTMAAAMTLGVQSKPGVGTTIKHFACNNQEDNRMGSNSIVSTRALREIYLKGFEIAIQSAQPMCIMSSYNLINGVHTANSYDLCTLAAREEWDFKGIIMTDWTTTTAGGSVSHLCAAAGNDLIMPGNRLDVEEIMQALATGELAEADARAAAVRMITILLQTSGMENAVPYREQFDLKKYIEAFEG